MIRNNINTICKDTCKKESNLNDMLDKVYQYINMNNIDIEDLKEKCRNEIDRVLSEVNSYTIYREDIWLLKNYVQDVTR